MEKAFRGCKRGMEAERVSWSQWTSHSVYECMYVCVRACACGSVCLSNTPVWQAQRGNMEEQVVIDVGEA